MKLLLQLAQARDSSLLEDRLGRLLAMLRHLQMNPECLDHMDTERLVSLAATALAHSLQLSFRQQASTTAALGMGHIEGILRECASAHVKMIRAKMSGLPRKNQGQLTIKEEEECTRKEQELAQAVAATGGQQC